MSRKLIAACAAAAALIAVPAAAAKDFRPGDLRLCDARRCVPLVSQPALDAISALYYGTDPLKTAVAPRIGAATLRLEFRNGYITGIVGTRTFDRFLSYGVDLDRLRRGTWYRVPVVAARELRRLATKLKPLRLTRAAIARSR